VTSTRVVFKEVENYITSKIIKFVVIEDIVHSKAIDSLIDKISSVIR